jgi:hypothetical protein
MARLQGHRCIALRSDDGALAGHRANHMSRATINRSAAENRSHAARNIWPMIYAAAERRAISLPGI